MLHDALAPYAKAAEATVTPDATNNVWVNGAGVAPHVTVGRTIDLKSNPAITAGGQVTPNAGGMPPSAPALVGDPGYRTANNLSRADDMDRVNAQNPDPYGRNVPAASPGGPQPTPEAKPDPAMATEESAKFYRDQAGRLDRDGKPLWNTDELKAAAKQHGDNIAAMYARDTPVGVRQLDQLGNGKLDARGLTPDQQNLLRPVPGSGSPNNLDYSSVNPAVATKDRQEAKAKGIVLQGDLDFLKGVASGRLPANATAPYTGESATDLAHFYGMPVPGEAPNKITPEGLKILQDGKATPEEIARSEQRDQERRATIAQQGKDRLTPGTSEYMQHMQDLAVHHATYGDKASLNQLQIMGQALSANQAEKVAAARGGGDTKMRVAEMVDKTKRYVADLKSKDQATHDQAVADLRTTLQGNSIESQQALAVFHAEVQGSVESFRANAKAQSQGERDMHEDLHKKFGYANDQAALPVADNPEPGKSVSQADHNRAVEAVLEAGQKLFYLNANGMDEYVKRFGAGAMPGRPAIPAPSVPRPASPAPASPTTPTPAEAAPSAPPRQPTADTSGAVGAPQVGMTAKRENGSIMPDGNYSLPRYVISVRDGKIQSFRER
jgi:hypothetical protein